MLYLNIVIPQLLVYNTLATCSYNPTNMCDKNLWDFIYCYCYYGNLLNMHGASRNLNTTCPS